MSEQVPFEELPNLDCSDRNVDWIHIVAEIRRELGLADEPDEIC